MQYILGMVVDDVVGVMLAGEATGELSDNLMVFSMDNSE